MNKHTILLDYQQNLGMHFDATVRDYTDHCRAGSGSGVEVAPYAPPIARSDVRNDRFRHSYPVVTHQQQQNIKFVCFAVMLLLLLMYKQNNTKIFHRQT